MNETTLFNLFCREALCDAVSNKEIKEFIMFEASDYQVFSLITEGVIPKEKSNIVHETLILDNIKKLVFEEKDIFGKDFAKQFLKLKPVNEEPAGIEAAKAARAAYLSAMKDKGEEELVSGATKVAAGSDGAGQAIITHTANNADSAVNATHVAAGSGGAGHAVVSHTGASHAVSHATANTGIASGTVAAKTSTLAGIGAKFGALTLAGKIAVGMGALVVAALLAYAAYKTYQRFFSRAAKACNAYKFKEKSLCIAKFKVEAMKKQINDLDSSSSTACKKTKNPQQCKLSIQKKLVKLHNKLKKHEYKVSKIQASSKK